MDGERAALSPKILGRMFFLAWILRQEDPAPISFDAIQGFFIARMGSAPDEARSILHYEFHMMEMQVIERDEIVLGILESGAGMRMSPSSRLIVPAVGCGEAEAAFRELGKRHGAVARWLEEEMRSFQKEARCGAST